MKKNITIWKAVREFWKTGKTGVALSLISILALIYGYIALKYEITQGWKGHISVQNVTKDISAFIPVAGTIVAMIIGGIDIMMLLADFIQERREQRLKEAVAAAREQAHVDGKAAGMAEVYQEIAAWNERRKEAEARGVEFTEPPPMQPSENGT